MIRLGDMGKIGFVLALTALTPTLTACGGDDDDTQPTTAQTTVLNNARCDLNASAANSGATALVNNQAFTIPSSAFAANATPAALKTQLLSSPTSEIKFTGVNKDSATVTITNPALTGTLKVSAAGGVFTFPGGTVTTNAALFFTGTLSSTTFGNITTKGGVNTPTVFATNSFSLSCKGTDKSITCKVGTAEVTCSPLLPTGAIGTAPPVTGGTGGTGP